MPDITNLSVEELKRLQAEAEALIASKKDQEIEDAYGGDTLLVARDGTLLAKYDYLLKRVVNIEQ